MKRNLRFIILLIVLMLGWAALAQARSSEGAGLYDLSWYTFDAGGGTRSSGSYTINGTIGQPEAALMSNGSYSLAGGFWGGTAVQYQTYLPLILKNR
jgi:hypothetical protein